MIIFSVNGKKCELEAPINLMEYIEKLGVNLQYTAIAHNGTVMPKNQLAGVMLSDGDMVEIVQAVGGG